MNEAEFISEIGALVSQERLDMALGRIVERMAADSGTIHLLGADGVLHLKASTPGIPQVVLDTVKTVTVGKGMAGLAVERNRPVDACNIQTDTSGDVRPGAKATGLQGAIVIPIQRADTAVGALGVANRGERTFEAEEIALLMRVGRLLASAQA